MNIFILHPSPQTSARWMINKHLGKQVVESAQILSNCYTLEELQQAPPNQQGNSRKHSYPNHPCCKWVKKSLSNAVWVISHAKALAEEKDRRMGSKRHFSMDFIEWCGANLPNIPDLGFTTPSLAMKQYPQIMDETDPYVSYRRFYVLDKRYDNAGRWMAYYPSVNDVPLFWREHWGLVQMEEGPFDITRFVKQRKG